ncbi:MAG: diguanylate cyclase [Gammaproteobacteria bacterium]|nr:diguanylate cyclase [Gammaproteobacteria bacterium]
MLVVDDDAAVRSMVGEVLRDDGHTVHEAGSGSEALTCLQRGGIDVVVTDLRMANGDGLDLLREVRANYEPVQAVVMTSYGSMDNAIAALKGGAYDFLNKPFESLAVVSETVKRALEVVRMTRERELLVATLTRTNSELEQLNNFFRELAVRDGLTNLFNHRHFQEAVTAEIERSKRYRRDLSMLFIDVDKFKQYNDTHGHPAGDEVLRGIAKILLHEARDSDIVARWGGEEFVVLAPETPGESAGIFGERLRVAVANHPFAGGATQPHGSVTISVGVATLDPGGNRETLIARADAAAYQAKAAGRNTVCIAAARQIRSGLPASVQ